MNASELQPTLAFHGHWTGGATLNDVLMQVVHKLSPWVVILNRMTLSFSFEINFPTNYLGVSHFPF